MVSLRGGLPHGSSGHRTAWRRAAGPEAPRDPPRHSPGRPVFHVEHRGSSQKPVHQARRPVPPLVVACGNRGNASSTRRGRGPGRAEILDRQPGAEEAFDLATACPFAPPATFGCFAIWWVNVPSGSSGSLSRDELMTGSRIGGAGRDLHPPRGRPPAALSPRGPMAAGTRSGGRENGSRGPVPSRGSVCLQCPTPGGPVGGPAWSRTRGPEGPRDPGVALPRCRQCFTWNIRTLNGPGSLPG